MQGGGPVETTGEPPKTVYNSHDFITFLPKTKENIYRRCLPLYEENLSLNEMARRTGFAKSSIRKALASKGLSAGQREFVSGYPTKKPVNKRSGVPPFGYICHEGHIIKEPREQFVVLDIYEQWQSGRAFRAIATNLNGRCITTRRNKQWTHEAIKRIINHHEEQLKLTKPQKDEV